MTLKTFHIFFHIFHIFLLLFIYYLLFIYVVVYCLFICFSVEESRGRRNQLRSWWGNRSSNAGTRGLFHRRHQRDKISAEHFFRTPKSHKRSDILCIDESRPEIIFNSVHWRFPNAKRVSILFANMFFILNSS